MPPTLSTGLLASEKRGIAPISVRNRLLGAIFSFHCLAAYIISRMYSDSKTKGGGVMRRPFACRVCLLLAISGIAMSPALAGETMTYTYDELGRLLVVQSAGSVNNNQAMTYCYDAVGNRMRVKSDANGALASCPAGSIAPPQKANPQISIGGTAEEEGEALTFSVTLDAPGTSKVTVDYATAYGTAGASDFTATSGTLVFSPGQTVRTISVPTTADTLQEGTESFSVNLSNPTGGASISSAVGSGTILEINHFECQEFICPF